MAKGGKGGSDAADQARQDEEERQKRIRQGTKRVNEIFGQFDDDFFNARGDAYMNYANPQLEDQYGDAKEKLIFSLDRAGTLDSSARAQKESELAKLYDTNKRAVSDQALTYANQARTGVEDARGNLITTLNATGDAEGAANSAISRASALSQPDSYSPLAQLFAGFTNALGQKYQADQTNQILNGLGVKLYDTSGSVQNTGS